MTFEKDFFKLMNNVVFGKTMETFSNRMQFYITTDDEKAMKWFSKLTFKDSRYFDGLHLIETYKHEIEYNKPTYVGTSILALSNLCMMEFSLSYYEKKSKTNII